MKYFNQEFTDKAKQLYPDCKEVYGPYKGKDNRLRICLYFYSGLRSLKSYPKVLTETRIGHRLVDNETVDHKDKNPLNNDPDNIVVLDRSTHCAKDVIRNYPQWFKCSVCGVDFELSGYEVSRLVTDLKTGRRKYGPFCSKRCAGIHGTSVQNNRVEYPKPVIPVIEQYCEKELEESGFTASDIAYYNYCYKRDHGLL